MLARGSPQKDSRGGGRMSNTSGRGGGRGGRGETRDYTASSSGPKMIRKKVSAEMMGLSRRNHEKDKCLSSIFSSQRDVFRAFNAIRFMLELHQMQDNNKSTSSKLERFIRNPATIGQILLPTLPEISYTLDLVDRHTEYFSDSMFEIRKAQALLETFLAKLNSVKDDKNKEGNGKDKDGGDLIRASKFSKIIRSESAFPVDGTDPNNKNSGINEKTAALVKSLQDQNMMRILEAHLYAAVINSNLSNPYVKSSPVDTAAEEKVETTTTDPTPVTELAEGTTPPTATNTPLRQAPPSRPPIAQILQSARVAPPPLYISPTDAPHYDATKTKMESIREKMTTEIRRRKLVKKAVWEELADRYLWIQHRWNKHVEDIEKEEQSEANLPINTKINELSRSATSGRGTINSSTPVIEPNLMQLPDRSTRSTSDPLLSKGLGRSISMTLLFFKGCSTRKRSWHKRFNRESVQSLV